MIAMNLTEILRAPPLPVGFFYAENMRIELMHQFYSMYSLANCCIPTLPILHLRFLNGSNAPPSGTNRVHRQLCLRTNMLYMHCVIVSGILRYNLQDIVNP